jgi:hypothetical protein
MDMNGEYACKHSPDIVSYRIQMLKTEVIASQFYCISYTLRDTKYVNALVN